MDGLNSLLYPALEALLLVVALSLDAFIASFAYGAQRIKIPFSSVIIISIICTAMLGVSLLLGALLRPHLPQMATKVLCFAILFLLGVTKLCDSAIKTLIRRHKKIHKKLSFSLFRLKFILDVYADPEKADRDGSRVLSPAEAASLAVALSLDGLAVGFGAALMKVNFLLVMLLSLVIGMLAVRLGGRIGNKAAQKLPFDLSWISGALLIMLAVLKL